MRRASSRMLLLRIVQIIYRVSLERPRATHRASLTEVRPNTNRAPLFDFANSQINQRAFVTGATDELERPRAQTRRRTSVRRNQSITKTVSLITIDRSEMNHSINHPSEGSHIPHESCVRPPACLHTQTHRHTHMHTDRHALDTHARKIYTLTHTRGDGDTAAAGPMTMTGASDGSSTASAGTAGAAGFAAAGPAATTA